MKRDGSSGTIARPTVKTAADGSFTITDALSSRGTFGYTASYAGDARHQAASKRLVVSITGTNTTVRILISAGPHSYGARPVAIARLGASTSRTVSIYFQDARSAKPALIKTGKVDSRGELRAAIYLRMRSNVYATFAGDNVYNPVSSLQRVTVRPHFIQKPINHDGISGGYALFRSGKRAQFDLAFANWNTGTCVTFETQQLIGGTWRPSSNDSCIRIPFNNGHLLVETTKTAPRGYRYRVRATFVGDQYNIRMTGGWMNYRFT